MMKCALCAIVITTTFLVCHAGKILVIFPVGAHSHFSLGLRLVQELANRGHQVTFISPFPQKNATKNIREISLAKIMEGVNELKEELSDLGTLSYISQLFWVTEYGTYFTENALKLKEMQQLLQSNETFDLIILEHFLNEAMMIFQYKFKCPSILLVASPINVLNNHLIANPSQPAYVPNILTNFGSHMTLWERLQNLYYDTIGELFISYVMIPRQNAVMQRTVPGAPDLKDILYNASFLLTTSHISLNELRPHQPNVKEIGGYHVLPPKPLPKDLKAFLDNAKEGVILFSMGANLKSANFPKEKREAILRVLGRLKQKVLWKFEADLPGKPDNVKIMGWIPQQDVLGHPNVVLFITHVGLLGKTEAVYHGVPLLGVPVFWDQEKNAAEAVRQGFGLSVPFHSLTEDDFERALNELLNNKKYRENAKLRSKIMRDQPMKPIDKAMFWIEYTIRHKGAPHYKSPALHLKWYQIQMLDVILIITLSISGIFLIIFCILRYIFKYSKNEQFAKKGKED